MKKIMNRFFGVVLMFAMVFAAGGVLAQTATPLVVDTTQPDMTITNKTTGPTTLRLVWSTNEPADGKMWVGTSSPVDVSDPVDVSQASFDLYHDLQVTGLTPGTMYYFAITSSDEFGNTRIKRGGALTNSVIAPVATTSNPQITITNKTTGWTTLRVVWTTDEPANSKLWVSTSSPVDTGTSSVAMMIGDSAMTTNHDLTVSGLASTTKYYFAIRSTDADGNSSMATGSALTNYPRTTEPSDDNNNPNILVLAKIMGTFSARFLWITNESTTDKIWLSTTTPVSISGPALATDNSPSLFHDLTVGGLASSTNYFYVVQTTDGSGNTTTATGTAMTDAP